MIPELVLVVLLLIGVVLMAPRFLVRRPVPNSCINNLRQIDGAVQQWALENRKTTNDTPAWSDLQPYLRSTLVCPEGGIYSLGRVQDLPRCSVAAHRLPPRTE
jgi:hypothetical protein